MGEENSGLGITARMEDLKRVGLYRLLGGIHGGKGAYSLREALDDMVIDYFLDKIGFFPAPALFGVKSPLGALLLKTVTKLANGCSLEEGTVAVRRWGGVPPP